jgi:hypothetical protein
MIVAYLAVKRISGPAIHDDLTAALGGDAVAYISVMRHLRKAQLLPPGQDSPLITVHRGIDDADQALLPALNENHSRLRGSSLD